MLKNDNNCELETLTIRLMNVAKIFTYKHYETVREVLEVFPWKPLRCLS